MNPTSFPRSLAPLALLAVVSSAHAAPEQVGDLRIGNDPYAGNFFYFDLGFSEGTRDVAGAPVQLPAVFSGTTQKPGEVGNPATDLGIQTYSGVTHLKNINRYATTPANANGRVGAFQYAINLSPIASYLSGSGEALTALDLRFEFELTDPAKEYDIYLSYTAAGEGITLTSIPEDPFVTFSDFWAPSQNLAEGDVVNGTHKILNLKSTGNLSQTTSLLDLYNAGVRQVNVMIVSGAFMSSRTIKVNPFSGIWLNTDGLGADTQVGDLRLGGFAGRFYHYDRLEPTETRLVEAAPVDVISQLSGTSQNQGANIDLASGLAYYDIDGIAASTGSTAGGSNATVVGYGAAGIGATAADGFQFTAWRHSGDFDVNVSLDSLDSLETGARAGLMVRNGAGVDAAHVFIGVQKDGAPVVVVRDADGATATQTVEAVGAFPKTLRIRRTGDLFEFWYSKNTTSPAADPNATVVMSNPVLVGVAATSGSDVEPATAVFTGASVALPDPAIDIGLRTYSTATTIRTLNRYLSSSDVGIVQWALDLAPLDDYLATSGKTLEGLHLRLVGDLSDELKPMDVYLSYTNEAEFINLIGIAPHLAVNSSLSETNYAILFEPAIGAIEGDIVNETHKVLVASKEGDLDVTEDLLALYNDGVRKLNLILTTNQYFLGHTIAIREGSGLFIETSGGASAVVVTEVSRTGNILSVTVDGLTSGNAYHLGGSANLIDFTSIPGTNITATGSADVLEATLVAPASFVQVLEGAAP